MYDILVVGGGPIGLNAAIEFAKRNKKVALLDNGDALGGQLTALYPEKEIVDIPGIASIKAKEYIDLLVKQINDLDNIDVILKEKVVDMYRNKSVCVKTQDNVFECKNAILTTGLGAFIPRKMNIDGEDECKNILYSLNDLSMLKDKSVLVLGGGDSALDWCKEISRISENVAIIHRRREFRGNVSTIANLSNIKILTPYIPVKIIKENDMLKTLVIEQVEDKSTMNLDADYVFVNYGMISANEFFNLENDQGGIKVNDKMETSLLGVYAIGDIARYENKVRRIAPGLKELEIIIKEII